MQNSFGVSVAEEDELDDDEVVDVAVGSVVGVGFSGTLGDSNDQLASFRRLVFSMRAAVTPKNSLSTSLAFLLFSCALMSGSTLPITWPKS